uniref:Heterogeneous nuclear ribonucleoprotein A0, like n=1 Tax=Pundamilia nyererei TaxID=303518 RepID=A0A3B4ERB3_9CICH
MGSKAVQLTSGSHHEHILASLHDLRLQGQLSDVTVQVDYEGDVEEFHAHQVMLAASSGYFKKILLSPHASRDKLSLSNMHSEDFSAFLEFVYTGKVEVARHKIGSVQAAAEFLDCDDLLKVCGEAISPFACDECDARFTQKHMLAYHKRSHTGKTIIEH